MAVNRRYGPGYAQQRATARILLGAGLGPTAVAAQIGVNPRTVNRWKTEWANEPAPQGAARSTTWQDKAACRQDGVDADLFFPVGTTGPALLQTEQAKQVCDGCPVWAACLQWALDTGEQHGIWGGLTEDERRAMRRRSAA